MQAKGSREWRDEDDKVIIPINTALHRMFGIKELEFMNVQVKEDADITKVYRIYNKKTFNYASAAGCRKRCHKGD